MNEKKPCCSSNVVEIKTSDLPLSCPMDDHILWNGHPKVYLPLEKHGECQCPYCGTRYKLV